MKVLQRYFASEIMQSVLFVLAAFLALFTFFDLVSELKYVGQGGYRWQHAFTFVVMGLPGYAYELMPIAVLIGTIYALARFAANSEFTVMRAASMSTMMAGGMLARIGLVFVIATILIGELLAPITAKAAEHMKMTAMGTSLKQSFRSGTWSKDQIRESGINSRAIGSRFMNIGRLQPDGQLRDLNIYELDADLQLTTIIRAKTAEYMGDNTWRLGEVTETVLEKPGAGADALVPGFPSAITIKKLEKREMVSDITPNILSVLFVKPDRMSAYDLFVYKKHLEENSRENATYQIAFWKKVIYPLSVFVMMAMALPFAYLHFRSGGISLKIFSGIMIGVGFVLLNNMLSHIGLLNTWPPFFTAALPSSLFLLMSVGALWWVERH